MVYNLLLAVASEIGFAKFSRLEHGLGSYGSGETALIERNTRQDSNFHLLAERKEVGFGTLVKDVVDDLNGLDKARFHGLESGIRVVFTYGDTHKADFAARAEIFDSSTPFVGIGPGVGPDVELLEVDLLDAEIAQTLVGGFDDVVIGENGLNWSFRGGGPDAVLRWNFGGHIGLPECLFDSLADKLFTVSIAICQRGVDEVYSKFKSTIQGP